MPMADFLLEHFWVNSRTSVEVNNYRQPMWPVATVLPYLIYPPPALQLFLETFQPIPVLRFGWILSGLEEKRIQMT